MSIPGSASPLFLSAAAAAAPAGFQIDRSLRFNSADSAYLSRTPASASNGKTLTWSGWVKKCALGTINTLFAAGSGIWAGGTQTVLAIYSDDAIWFFDYNGSGYTHRKITTQLFRDPSAWYHIVAAVDTTAAAESDRVKLYVNGEIITDFSTNASPSQNYTLYVNNTVAHYISLNTASGLDGYLADVHFIDGQALAPTDFGEYDSNNVWQPKDTSGLTFGTNGFHLDFSDNSSNAALGTDSSGNNNTWTVNNLTAGGASTSAIELDGNDKVTFPGVTIGTGDVTCECFFNLDTSSTSGFRRILSHTYGGSGNTLNMRVHNNGQLNIVFDDQSYTGTTVTQGVWHHMAVVRSGSTISFYYDGERKGTGTSSTDMTLNNVILGWGNGSEYFPGQIHGARITKQALYSGTTYTVPTEPITTTSQGATASNVLHLSATTSSTTTNSGTTADGTDGGDPTVVTATPFAGSSGIDSLIDTPTNYTAGSGNNGGNYATLNPLYNDAVLANGNLEWNGDGSISHKCTTGTIGMSSGKYYWEAEYTVASYSYVAIGMQKIGTPVVAVIPGYNQDYAFSILSSSGTLYYNNTGSSYGVSWAVGDIIGVRYDNGSVYFYKNGTIMNSGTAAVTGLTGTWVPIVHNIENGAWAVNFGQRPFAYTLPTDHLSLCTTNLTDPTIADGSTAMDIVTYSGTGTTQSITGLAFSPDFVWLKCRNAAKTHRLYDAVRGATKVLQSDLTDAEGTDSAGLTSFNSDGFTLGGSGGHNGSSDTMVSWAWDAGTSTVSNTDGSITSSVRANASAGFSIVSYDYPASGSFTIGHGLNAVPAFIIYKNRNRATSWFVYHSAATSKDQYLILNSTSAVGSSTNFWGTSAPTNTVFGSTVGVTGISTDESIAYCFAPVAGYSAFGEYTGNGSADGPFVYTGFRPKWLMLKVTQTTGNYQGWYILDTARDPYNESKNRLHPNSSATDATMGAGIDFLSNGFKLRSSDTDLNGAYTYIYAAFAEHPLRHARAR